MKWLYDMFELLSQPTVSLMNGSMAQSCQFTFFMTNESIYGLLFFFFFWRVLKIGIEIETVRKFPKCSHG